MEAISATTINNDEEPVPKKAKVEDETPKISKDTQIVGSLTQIKTTNDCSKNENVSTTTNATQVSTPVQSVPPKVLNESKVETLSLSTEKDAGITEYIGDHNGFTAIIKQRYSDFIVNEVDIDGNVVHLTDLSSPADEEEKSEEQDLELINTEDGKSSLLGADDMSKLKALVQENDNNASVNIHAPEDKNVRTNIHLAIKRHFEMLETKTVDIDGTKMIQVFFKKGKKRDFRRDEWPKSKKSCRFIRFVLYKENKDTMDAIGLIAKNLKVKENMFQYAGTKDKRAKTSQEITAHRIHPQKLFFLNKMLRNMGLGNFRYVSEPLKLGQLSGNQFLIVLRNVEGPKDELEKALTDIQKQGFVNYFGMQRFGTTSVATHKIGCALLHEDWDKAINLILMPRGDLPEKDAFQQVWKSTKDPVATLEATPRFCGLERNLLEGLKKKMKPFNALERISRNTRLLYVHSYQALVWNTMVSKRLSHFGHKVIDGDLVIRKGTVISDESKPITVTAEDIDQYTLQDVVLPLPGHDVIYPQNGVHQWYREMLEKDGLDLDNMKRSQKDYSLPGAYRHITVIPSDVHWSHHRYDDYTLPLTLSDWDKLNGETVQETNNKGKLRAVVLKMTLPSSCYATMALREILRQDTSSAHQTTLNVS